MALTSMPACCCCQPNLSTSVPLQAMKETVELVELPSTVIKNACSSGQRGSAPAITETSDFDSMMQHCHVQSSSTDDRNSSNEAQGTSLFSRNKVKQKFLLFDFNLVFNTVVVGTNVAYFLCTLTQKVAPTSVGEWVSTLVILNIVFPGMVVTIDSLPGDLGTYLLIVVVESVAWLVLADWRLRGTFQKQSECILVLLLWSICTSYVAWSIPALYMGFVGGKLDATLGVLFAMMVQGSCYYLLELVLVEEHRRLFEGPEGSAGGQSPAEERAVLEQEALDDLTTLIPFTRGRLDHKRIALHAGRQLDESCCRRLRKESCAICASELIEVKKKVLLRRLDWCEHVFHRQCVDEWLLRHNSSCPLCRQRPLEEVT
ncbi:hypothetical protein GUITHDRAFT_145766 [Guillardia theta CCMP2712]|uniref:RING-type domain-containing protein n=2 Tax=Guillardia theta TaxID=55529 RepID=L1IJX1_GUITC|nr:hypothetical protein GUITHDRAFT_145766 [Guillardia theta CCMP2712]EKX36397.1 hypothetical protein GUITHDRAFT_145766 [Guillardia theta CCMP2712]|eukprot:XP_005823377.1 hypothetical protein GUITHDRAFT_145766 [Guillardia theta CCMP2712]